MLAIVLERRNVREVDQIVSFYTEEVGRKDLLVRGVKKITSKQSGHLEPASLSDVAWTLGKEMDILIQAQTHRTFNHIHKNFFSRMAALHLVNAVERICQIGEQDKRIFRLIEETLSRINLPDTPLIPMMDFFFLHLMAYLGFSPDMSREHGQVEHYFSLSDGRFVSAPDQESPQYCVLTEETCQQVDSYLRSPTDHVVVSPNHVKGTHDFVYLFTRFHTERPLPDWGMYQNFAKI